MKKKIILSLFAVVLMLQGTLPVSASELPASSLPEESVVSEDTSINFSDPSGVTDIAYDDLLGLNPTVPNNHALTGPSVSGYYIIDPWKYYYVYNIKGRTIYSSNVYVNGQYQNRNVARANNSRITYYNNYHKQRVVYYKYDASTHKLLTTWSNAEDWPYLDVFPSVVNWEYNAIKYCADRGLMVGTGANLFDPNVPITRAMFATIVYRMAGSPKVTYSNVFPDVPSGQWYSDGITWASKNGIVKGFGNGYYAPYEIITREQATAILQRYAQYCGYQVSDRTSLSGFSDGAAVSAWAKENVSWAVAKGLMSGRPNGSQLNLAPKASTSRAECASMIMRYKENIGQ